MAFNVLLYSAFIKANNSLKVPSATSTSITIQGTLKENTSITNPSISFNMSMANMRAYTYAYIAEFGRYYFIRNWVFEGALIRADMVVDVLGTYRESILASSQYVLRSASSYDGSLIDTYYPMTAQPSTEVTQSAQIYFPSSGSYVIGVINGSGTDAGKIGCTSYYVVDEIGMQSIASALLDTSTYSIADVSTNMAKAIVDPFQYITSVRYYPVTISTDTPNSYMNVGFWTISDISCIPLFVLNKTVQFDITVPKNPNADDRGIWLNNSPYSTYELSIYPFGTFILDSNLLMGVTAIRCTILLDIPTGVASLTVISADTLGRILIRTDAQLGVDLPISQITQDYLGASISLVQGANGIVQNFAHYGNGSGGLVSEAIADVGNSVSIMAGTVGDVVNALAPKVQSKGAMGLLSGFSFGQNCYATLQSTFLIPAEQDNTHNGRPLCRTVVLNTLSGYCVCQNPKVELSGACDSEKRAVESYLVNGVYIE